MSQDSGESGFNSIRNVIENQESEEGPVSVFENPELLDPNTIVDTDRIVGRDDQLEDIVSILRPALNGVRPRNMFLYGPSGTGKSLISNAVGEEIAQMCDAKGIDFALVRLQCQEINTHGRAVYELVANVADIVGIEPGVPENGVSTKKQRDRLVEIVDNHFDIVLFIIDEIDKLQSPHSKEPAFSKLIYQLSRIGPQGDTDAKVSIAALSNDPRFLEKLDGRAESSYDPVDVFFPDYNAHQLRNILENRRDAFKEGVLDESALQLASAVGAEGHGDARKAINLLRKAGKIADRDPDLDKVTELHVREAQDDVEVDRVQKFINGLSTQKKISLYAFAAVAHFTDTNPVPSTVGYNIYTWLTEKIDANQRNSETVNLYLKEIASYGLIDSFRKGLGQGQGVVLLYKFDPDPETIMKAVKQGDDRLFNVQAELKALAKKEVQEYD